MNARRLTLLVLVTALGVLAFALAAVPALAIREYAQAFSFGQDVNQTKVNEREAEEAKGEPVTITQAEENVCTAASGDTCQPGMPGAGKGQFERPLGVAVNDASGPAAGAGDVYVVDKGNNRIERFSSSGAYLGQFNGSGAFEVEGKEEKGAAAPTGRLAEPKHIAVDDSGNVLDPSVGDVYVADTEHKVVDKFSATGEYLAQLGETTTGTRFGALNGVAVDPSGNLWIYDQIQTEHGLEGKIDEFSDTGSFTQSFETGSFPSRYLGGGGLAADATNVYVGQEGEVGKFESATGKKVAQLVIANSAGQGVHDLAVNPSNDSLLVDDNSNASEELASEILVYGPGGEPYNKPLQVVAAEPPLAASWGDAVSGESALFASERLAADVRVFDSEQFPAVVTEPATFTTAGVTLHGSVDPEGEEVTECQFEYGLRAGEYSHTAPCSPQPPLSGSSAVPVSASPAGLEPRMTYHFRLSARAAETKKSGDDTFFSSTQPLVEGESSSDVASTTATVSARIDPAGLATTYRVEYGTSEAYGSSTPETSAGTASEGVGVLVRVSGLSPGVKYHFRFVVSNALGVTGGADASFETFAATVASSTLPNERVYELVSTSSGPGEASWAPTTPVDQTEDLYSESLFQAAADGNAVTYKGDPADTGGDGETANQWLATRGAEGWTTSDITPLGSDDATVYAAFSSDLATGFLVTSPSQSPLASDAPAECRVLYSRASASGSYRALLNSTETPGDCGHPNFAGESTDGSQVIFESEAALTGDAMEATEVPVGHGGDHVGGGAGEPCDFGCNLYDAVSGGLRLVNVLPDGEADADATFGGPANLVADGPDLSNAIASDGSRIFWTDTARSGPDQEHIYVLEDGTSNAQVSPGAAKYWTATPDGRYAFYTEGEKLWRFDTQSNTREALVNEGLGGESAGVQGVLGVNDTGEDGAYVYFVATAVLANGENGNGEKAEAGQDNLYLRHAGATVFIARLSPADDEIQGSSLNNNEQYGDWAPNLGNRTAEVSPDGRHLVFESVNPLTGYDNVDVARGERALEVFVYAADTGGLACASCNPTGVPPQIEVGGARPTLLPVSASSTYMPRWMSEDGSRVFFDTSEALAPNDTNGVRDVYEWEREGASGCPAGSPVRSDGGCIFLISGGESPQFSDFVDASANGSDVFFTTREQLVLEDQDQKMDLYDARVDGYRPVSPPSCTGTGCQGVPPAPPIFASPASVTFNGIGNFEAESHASSKPRPRSAKCRRGSVRRRGKCVRKKRAKQVKRSGRRSKRGSK